MRLTALLTLASLGLGACATPSIKSPKVCDGRQRRPANPNGITLPMPVQSDAVAPSGVATVNVFDTPGERADPATPTIPADTVPVVPAIALTDGEPR